MPTDSPIKYVKAIEDSTFTLLARIKGASGGYLTQDALTSITYAVHDTADGAEIGTGTLTIADVVYDTLQLDDLWDEDQTGYNFRWDVNPTLIPEGDKHYRFEITFTPSSGFAFKVVYDVETEGVYSS